MVLFIVALATPAVIQTSGELLPGTTFHGQYGPFRVCSHLNSESDSCKAVDGHCEFSLRPVSGVEIKVPVVKDCDKWNAARGLLVIAAIAAIIAFLLQLVAVTSAGASRGVRGGAAFLALLSALCGMVSMALFANMKNDDVAFEVVPSDLGYGFWMLTVGWVLMLIAALPFCRK